MLEMLGRLLLTLVLVRAEHDVLSCVRLEAMTGSIGAIVSTPASPTASGLPSRANDTARRRREGLPCRAKEGHSTAAPRRGCPAVPKDTARRRPAGVAGARDTARRRPGGVALPCPGTQPRPAGSGRPGKVAGHARRPRSDGPAGPIRPEASRTPGRFAWPAWRTARRSGASTTSRSRRRRSRWTSAPHFRRTAPLAGGAGRRPCGRGGHEPGGGGRAGGRLCLALAVEEPARLQHLGRGFRVRRPCLPGPRRGAPPARGARSSWRGHTVSTRCWPGRVRPHGLAGPAPRSRVRAGRHRAGGRPQVQAAGSTSTSSSCCYERAAARGARGWSGTDDATGVPGTVRLDKWLWAVRTVPTRTTATDLCSAGRVRVAGAQAAPPRQVAVGDEVTISGRWRVTACRVERVLDRRVGASIASTCTST